MKKKATNHRFKKLLKATGPIPGDTFEHGDTCLTNDKAYLSVFNLFTLVSHYKDHWVFRDTIYKRNDKMSRLVPQKRKLTDKVLYVTEITGSVIASQVKSHCN